MTKEQNEQARARIAATARRGCAHCGGNDFGIESEMTFLPSKVPNSFIPAVAVICCGCGQISFFAAQVLGLTTAGAKTPWVVAEEGAGG